MHKQRLPPLQHTKKEKQSTPTGDDQRGKRKNPIVCDISSEYFGCAIQYCAKTKRYHMK